VHFLVGVFLQWLMMPQSVRDAFSPCEFEAVSGQTRISWTTKQECSGRSSQERVIDRFRRELTLAGEGRTSQISLKQSVKPERRLCSSCSRSAGSSECPLVAMKRALRGVVFNAG